jgi:hypothetical protein
MAEEKLEDKFFEVGRNMARHNLEVSLKRFKDECFRVAKLIAQDAATGKAEMDTLRQMDTFVRSTYIDDPRRMAEWEELTRGFDLSEEEGGG